jgi:hypothetical protein
MSFDKERIKAASVRGEGALTPMAGYDQATLATLQAAHAVRLIMEGRADDDDDMLQWLAATICDNLMRVSEGLGALDPSRGTKGGAQ